MVKLIKIFCVIGVILISPSCEKNRLHPVPHFQFDVVINLTLPSYQPLMGVGGWAYVTGAGSKGVVIYRRSVAEFVAFDRHSPADPEGTCDTPLMTNEDNFLVLDDPCSDAQFSLFDGSIISGDVDWGLRAYFAEVNAQQDRLRIYNP
jgi:hypothetical protein